VRIYKGQKLCSCLIVILTCVHAPVYASKEHHPIFFLFKKSNDLYIWDTSLLLWETAPKTFQCILYSLVLHVAKGIVELTTDSFVHSEDIKIRKTLLWYYSVDVCDLFDNRLIVATYFNWENLILVMRMRRWKWYY